MSISMNILFLEKFELMGKGDKKTKRGKISKGTYGVSRPKSANKKSEPAATRAKKKKK